MRSGKFTDFEKEKRKKKEAELTLKQRLASILARLCTSRKKMVLFLEGRTLWLNEG